MKRIIRSLLDIGAVFFSTAIGIQIVYDVIFSDGIPMIYKPGGIIDLAIVCLIGVYLYFRWFHGSRKVIHSVNLEKR